MTSAVTALVDLLDLEPLEHNLYRGSSPQDGWQRVFGGQVIGQALVAASRTVEDGRPVHSLHGYFMRPGDPKVPIVYQVARIHEGRSFLTRRVVAIQHGAEIFTMVASFQTEEPGLDHQTSMPDVPSPDDLPSEDEMREKFIARAPVVLRRIWAGERPVEVRPVDYRHYLTRERLDPVQNIWIRVRAPLPDDPALHRAVLAYMSDLTLLDTTLFAHGRSFLDSDLQMASLDHAIWFHRPFRADDWLLYSQDSPSSSGARGLSRGSLYTRDGRLVASTAQEGLIRAAPIA